MVSSRPAPAVARLTPDGAKAVAAGKAGLLDRFARLRVREPPSPRAPAKPVLIGRLSLVCISCQGLVLGGDLLHL